MLGQDRKGHDEAWEYKGYVVDQGFKPEPRERFQYFLRVLKDGERVFRYCIWTSKRAIADRWPDLDIDTTAGKALLRDRMRSEGQKRVREKIDAGMEAGVFDNWLLDLRGDDEEEVVLEEKDA
jgi:hypothetical protein